ncbi:hypothetical protein B0H14DRAFT_2565553 [Mycena olivaceomarginata]|nr:hypothetical protein B0H14DRAFT_2565553 [Mycena olivaceomarginata]
MTQEQAPLLHENFSFDEILRGALEAKQHNTSGDSDSDYSDGDERKRLWPAKKKNHFDKHGLFSYSLSGSLPFHFGKYLEVILNGLCLRKRWTRDLFLHWDTTLFPTLNGSHFGGGMAPEAEELSAARDQLLEMPSVPEIDLDEDDDL